MATLTPKIELLKPVPNSEIDWAFRLNESLDILDDSMLVANTSGVDGIFVTDDGSGNVTISGGGDLQNAYNASSDGIIVTVAGKPFRVIGTISGSEILAGDLTTSGEINIVLPSGQGFLIDGSTNPRAITTGAFRQLHTPAIAGTRALNYVIDANSQPDTSAIVADYEATGLGVGQKGTVHKVNVDTADSTGGIVESFHVETVGSGSAAVHALHAGPGVAPVEHESGAFADVNTAFTFDDSGSSFADVTAAFNSSSTNVQIFVEDNDIVYIGEDVQFGAVSVILDTPASNPGIKPVCEFWNGSAWTSFGPTDGTNGFRGNGLISWTPAELIGWATTTVNGANKFWMRIIRTANNLNTVPTEEFIQTSGPVLYKWDAAGDVTINNLTAAEGLFSNDVEIQTKLGIGTASPAESLHVVGSGFIESETAVLELSSSDPFDQSRIELSFLGTTVWTIGNDTGEFFVSDDLGNKIFNIDVFADVPDTISIDIGSRVGIGRPNPTEKLHVEGNTIVEDQLAVGGSSFTHDFNVTGSGIFTERVEGVTPVIDEDLTTKLYVDTEIDSNIVAVSGHLQSEIDAIDDSVTLQDAYDNGTGAIQTTTNKTVVISGTPGEEDLRVVGSGTFVGVGLGVDGELTVTGTTRTDRAMIGRIDQEDGLFSSSTSVSSQLLFDSRLGDLSNGLFRLIFIPGAFNQDGTGNNINILEGFEHAGNTNIDSSQLLSVGGAFFAASSVTETAAITVAHTTFTQVGYSATPKIFIGHDGASTAAIPSLVGYEASPVVERNSGSTGTTSITIMAGFATNAPNPLRAFLGNEQLNPGFTTLKYAHFIAHSDVAGGLLTTGGVQPDLEIGLDLQNINIGVELMSIRSTGANATMRHLGDVSIGKTTAPNAPLDVVGSGIFSTSIEADSGIFSTSVGIGTSNPTNDLHIDGTSDTIMRIDGDSAAFVRLGDLGSSQNNRFFDIISNDGDLVFRALTDDGVDPVAIKGDRMTIDPSGQIGIGTTSPTESLHVVGSGILTGDLDVQQDVEVLGTVVNMPNLPTVSAGLNSGDLWVDLTDNFALRVTP